MRKRKSLAFACLGMLAGVSAGYAARSTASTQMWSTESVSPASTELASESGYYVRIDPASVTRDGARERLSIKSRVGTTQQVKVRSIASVQLEDDRGTVVEPAKVSPRMDLQPATEVVDREIALPALADGWYRLRAHAVFVDPNNPKEALGSENDSLYLEVRGGEIYVVDMADWFAGSNANLGRTR